MLGNKLEKNLQQRLINEKEAADELRKQGLDFGTFEALKKHFVLQDDLLETKEEL